MHPRIGTEVHSGSVPALPLTDSELGKSEVQLRAARFLLTPGRFTHGTQHTPRPRGAEPGSPAALLASSPAAAALSAAAPPAPRGLLGCSVSPGLSTPGAQLRGERAFNTLCSIRYSRTNVVSSVNMNSSTKGSN